MLWVLQGTSNDYLHMFLWRNKKISGIFSYLEVRLWIMKIHFLVHFYLGVQCGPNSSDQKSKLAATEKI